MLVYCRGLDVLIDCVLIMTDGLGDFSHDINTHETLNLPQREQFLSPRQSSLAFYPQGV